MGTRLRALSESCPINTNFTGFRWFSKNLFVLVLWEKVAPALEGLTLEFKGQISLAFLGMNGSNVTMRNSHMLVDTDLLMNV